MGERTEALKKCWVGALTDSGETPVVVPQSVRSQEQQEFVLCVWLFRPCKPALLCVSFAFCRN